MRDIDTKKVRREDVTGFVMLLLRTGWALARDAERMKKDIEEAIDKDRPPIRSVILDEKCKPIIIYDGEDQVSVAKAVIRELRNDSEEQLWLDTCDPNEDDHVEGCGCK